jgi:uncharacterized membrane protein YphA (DoxX/SURF4 family)
VRPPHSRLTGAIRLGLAVWLIASAVRALADPGEAVAEQGMPMSALLPVAGLGFTLGVFLLTGFMSRVCGLILACLAAWQVASYGWQWAQIFEALVGIHLMLRGGGAWAMDIYVQKMQDRVRQKATESAQTGETRKTLSSPESW